MQWFILFVHLLCHTSSTLIFLESTDLYDGFGHFYPRIGPTYHNKEISFTAVLQRKLQARTTKKRISVSIPDLKVYYESRSEAPSTLNLATKLRWAVTFTPQPIYPPIKIPVPTEQEAAWTPLPVQMVLKKAKISCLCRDLNTVSSGPQLVAIPTMHMVNIITGKYSIETT